MYKQQVQVEKPLARLQLAWKVDLSLNWLLILQYFGF